MDIKEIRRARVRQIIDRDFGGTDSEFAHRIGRQPSYISRIFTDKPEHRRNIGEGLARKIEIECGLEPGYLDLPFGDESVGSSDAEAGRTKSKAEVRLDSIDLWDDSTEVEDDEVAVPFLKEVELAAGTGRFVIEESTKASLRFGKRNLRHNGVQFDHASCVTVRGNSMLPVLRDGATVGINTTKRSIGDIIDGDLYAINHNGQLRVKQLYRLPIGIRLRSFNRDEHPDEDYTFQQMNDEQIEILGHVFWWGMYAR